MWCWSWLMGRSFKRVAEIGLAATCGWRLGVAPPIGDAGSTG